MLTEFVGWKMAEREPRWLASPSVISALFDPVVFLDLLIIYVNAPRGLQKTVFVSGHNILPQ